MQNTRVSRRSHPRPRPPRLKRSKREGGTRCAVTWVRMRRASRGLHTSLSLPLSLYVSICLWLSRSFLRLYTPCASIRQLSSIQAAQAPQGGPLPLPHRPSRPHAGDLAVKSRLRAAHDTLNPRLVDPETFNLDVTACCREEISLYSRDTPSLLPRGRCSGADRLRVCSRSGEGICLLQFWQFRDLRSL